VVKSLSSSLRSSAFSAPRRYLFPRLFVLSLLVCFITSFCGCSHTAPDPSSLTFLIEANPTNLDPRYATDAFSQRIDGLLFSGLLRRDAQTNLQGDLADSWEIPNPLTYVFHPGVRFHDGRPLTSADVKSTFEFILNPANRSPKRGAFRLVTSIDAPDALTVSPAHIKLSTARYKVVYFQL
jgi:peptide/nickel transport system substrate-binding protein